MIKKCLKNWKKYKFNYRNKLPLWWKDVNMEEKDLKFNEKLQELVKIAKSKKSIIEDHEINDFFKDMQLEIDSKQPCTNCRENK